MEKTAVCCMNNSRGFQIVARVANLFIDYFNLAKDLKGWQPQAGEN